MNIREISKPVTARSLNESLAKKFGQKIDIDRFTLEQLQDARNKVRTKLSQVETNESFNGVHNDTYQKSKMFLDVLNAAIAEREEIAEKAKPDYLDLDSDGNKKEPMKKAAKDAKKKKGAVSKKKTNENTSSYRPGQRPPAEVMSRLVDVNLQSLASKFEDPEVVIDFFDMQHSVKQDPDTGEFYMYDDISEVYYVFDDTDDMEEYAEDQIDRQGSPAYESLREGGDPLGIDPKTADYIKTSAAELSKYLKKKEREEEEKFTSSGDSKDESFAEDFDDLFDRDFDRVPPEDHNDLDYEGSMAQKQLATIDDAAEELADCLKANENLPEWVQKKIILAKDYIDTARDYLKSAKKVDKMRSMESVIREGAEDQAEIVMAAKGMVDKITSWLEDTAEMQTESMLELADAIRDEMGSEQSETFIGSIKPALETLYTTMEETRSTLASGVGILTGEEEPTQMMGDEEPEIEPTVDAEAGAEAEVDAEAGDEFAAAEPAAGGEEEAGRAKRESIERSRRIASILTSKKK